MSLDKAIKHGKEHRKGYKERGKSGEYDRTCRPHGNGRAMVCSYCERNRLFSSRRRVEAVDKLQDEELYSWLWSYEEIAKDAAWWSGDEYREIDWLFSTIGSDCSFEDYILIEECLKY